MTDEDRNFLVHGDVGLLYPLDQGLVGKSDKSLCHPEDANDDALPDLVCQFENELEVQEGASIAVLEGETFDGTPIRGEDSIRIVPD